MKTNQKVLVNLCLVLMLTLVLILPACSAPQATLQGTFQSLDDTGKISIVSASGEPVSKTLAPDCKTCTKGTQAIPLSEVEPGMPLLLYLSDSGEIVERIELLSDSDTGNGDDDDDATPTPTSNSIDAAQIYAANCAGCHGANRQGGSGPALTTTVLANRTLSWVTGEVNHSGRLTSAQIPLMASYLKGITPTSTVTSTATPTLTTTTTPVENAAQIYAANCAGCHGANRQGGSGPALTTSALANMTISQLTGRVNHSGRLTSAQIPLMANYLKGITTTTTPAPTLTPTPIPTPTPSTSLIDAAMLFSASCSGCHGVNGQGGSAPALTNSALSSRTLVYLVSRVNHSGLLTTAQIPVMANALKGIITTTSAPPPSTSNPHINLSWDGSGTCLQCHEKQAGDIFHSVHYQWKGSTPFITNGPDIQGKDAGSFNAFCINILGNWNACGSCHPGLGAKPGAVASAAEFQNIDCLICHQKDYKRVKSGTAYIPDTANMVITMDQAVRTVHLPERSNCLQCHARSGGGDAFKRGDLTLAHGATADRNFDVHMATTGANLNCTDCHQWIDHHVEGRGADLRPSDLPGVPMCTDCHSEKATSTGHTTAAVNRHVGAVACQSCHSPIYGKDAGDSTALEMTEVHRTWQQSVFAGDKYAPMLTIANNVMPEYRFWNSNSTGYNLFDTASISPDTGNYAISRPQGSINDPNRKLYPFKFKTSEQPLMTRLKQLIALDTSVFFATGNPIEAIKAGLRNMGYTDTEPYSWVITDEFLALNHEVSPKEQALTCADCHDTTNRMDLQALGYVLKGPQSTVCSQCHDAETPGNYIRLHDDHLAENINCNSCHTFSRVQPASTPAPTSTPTPTGTPTPTPTPVVNAAQVYTANCAGCHGANRQGGSGPALTTSALANRSVSWLTSRVNHSGRLTSAQIPVMANYLKGVTATPTPTTTTTPTVTPTPTPTPMVNAAQIYSSNCASCHGANRQGGSGPALTTTALSSRTLSWVTSRVNHSGRLTSAQIPVVAEFLKNTPP